MNASAQIDRDRLSVLLGGVAVGFAMSKVIQLPSQHVAFSVLGSELGVQLSTPWLMMTFVLGLVISGVRSLFSLHPLYRQSELRRTAIFWILPALTTLAIGVLLARTEAVPVWLLLMFGGIGLLQVVITSEFRSLDSDELGRSRTQIYTRILGYLLALLLFMFVYSSRARTLLLAPAIFVISSLLALRLYWCAKEEIAQVALYAGVTGLVVGQSVWALNYWQTTPLAGGLYLLLFFYVATGLVGQSLTARLNGRIVLEYAVLALVAALLIPRLQI